MTAAPLTTPDASQLRPGVSGAAQEIRPMQIVANEDIGEKRIVSWRAWVAVPFGSRRFEYRRACPASPLAEGERTACRAVAMRRREVRGERPQRQSGSDYSSPSSVPHKGRSDAGAGLFVGSRAGSHLSCHCRPKPYKIAPASSSLGVSTRAPPGPLPAGSTATQGSRRKCEV